MSLADPSSRRRLTRRAAGRARRHDEGAQWHLPHDADGRTPRPATRHRGESRKLLPTPGHLVPTALATAASAVAGSIATGRSVDTRWFDQLRKPGFFPPRWAFPAAWTALYTDIAVTCAKALDELDEAERRALWRALVVNLGLNSAWCWTFFARRELALATPVAAALTISSADLARRVGRAGRGLGAALAPYPLWCVFATALSLEMSALNPEED